MSTHEVHLTRLSLFESPRYVTYCMRRVNLLRDHAVEPIMVFDGASLPMKGDKHLARRRYVPRASIVYVGVDCCRGSLDDVVSRLGRAPKDA